jgi:hypothetical protein
MSAQDEGTVAAMARAHYEAVNNRIHGNVWPLWEDLVPERREWFCADMRLALAALDAAGLAVVPKEPTEEMRRAAFVRDMGPHECLYTSIYRAMVAAAKEGEP